MLHAPHSAIAGPAHLVGVADDILVVGIRILREEPLDQILGVLLAKAEDHDEAVQVPAVQADGVPELRVHILEGQELVGQLRRPGDLRGPGQTQHQQVQDHAVVLEDEGSELQALDQTVRVGVVHVLVVDDNVVLRSHVVCDVVIDDQSEQSVQQREVHLLRHVLELAFQDYNALTV